MTSSKSLKIKEDLKRDVLNYLTSIAEKKGSLEESAIPSIEDATEGERERIEEVLNELEKENLITKHDVSLKIFVPKSDEGKRLLKQFASREVLSSSPYWLFVFSLTILWIAIPYFGLSLPSGVAQENLSSAYIQGIQNGIVYAGITGLVGGYILQGAIGKFIRWKMLSPDSFNQIVSIAKITVIILVIGWLAYNYLAYNYGIEFSLAALTIFIASLGVAIAYMQLKTRKE